MPSFEESSGGWSEPPRPQPIDAGVRDGRRRDTAVLAPGAAVENSRDGGQQNVAPVEVRGTFIEVREAEQRGSDDERGAASEAALEQILHPGAEEKFFRDGDKNKNSRPRKNCLARRGQVGMGMDKSER